jgi:hypothetical protein
MDLDQVLAETEQQIQAEAAVDAAVQVVPVL